MVDILLRPHQSYAAAYLDDVVHSENWEEHLAQLRRVLLELWRAGLTANPRKCHLALFEARYLGFQVGRGLIRPQEKKVLDSLGPATLHQDPGTSLFGVGGILSLFHSQLLLFSFSPDRSDQEGTAGEGVLGS